MLLHYDGLDTIGDEEDNYKDEACPKSDLDSDFNTSVGGTKDIDVQEEKAEVQVGYAKKRSQLQVHHKFALHKGVIRWMKTTDECRKTSRAGPDGCFGPWTLNQGIVIVFNSKSTSWSHKNGSLKRLAEKPNFLATTFLTIHTYGAIVGRLVNTFILWGKINRSGCAFYQREQIGNMQK